MEGLRKFIRRRACCCCCSSNLVPIFLLTSTLLSILCNHVPVSRSSQDILQLIPSSESEGHHGANMNIIASHLNTYIVLVRPPAPPFPWASNDNEAREEWYRSFLPRQPAAADHYTAGKPRMLYAYHHALSGFAARLTEGELAAMREVDGFLAAYPDDLLQLQTTRTPEFLGLYSTDNGDLWKASKHGEGMIIGVVDTGINPNHPSFRCSLPPPPPKWKGKCDFGPEECSNKIIGAMAFTQGADAATQGPTSSSAARGLTTSLLDSTGPYDEEGHGTHDASVAAGCFVPNASTYGNAHGTAVGMAPSAHLAIYKVCSLAGGCRTTDVIAGLDKAISDGVDVLSFSLGRSSLPFYSDQIAAAAFAGIEKGIFASFAAMNRGPYSQSLSNEAPWILTVATSSIDRSIRATVRLGNGLQYHGESLYQPANVPPEPSTLLPLVYAGICEPSSFEGLDVKGKVVSCDVSDRIYLDVGANVKSAGGAAMIYANTAVRGYTTQPLPHALPASYVSFADGNPIRAYAQSSSPSPTAAIIFEGTVMGGEEPTAPAVDCTSSRGPNAASPGILKPDIVGPGTSILGAWNEPVGPLPDGPTSMFNMYFGSSIATAHMSGIAALLKKIHPTLSPAAIKSAMMTTATIFNRKGGRIVDETGNPASYFAMGSGHVNPARAAIPGLVYDIEPAHYLGYLCGGLNYKDDQVSAIAGRTIKCSALEAVPEDQLNYPSFRIFLTDGNNFSRTVSRTVTNVGVADNSCHVMVDAPQDVSVKVNPVELAFTAENQQRTFSVTFSKNTATSATGGGTASGSLAWACTGDTMVTTPMMVSY